MPQPDSQPTNSLGLKSFNQTGRNDTTTEVLRPKTDPAVVRRNFILIGLVVVAFLAAAYFVFQRSGLDWNSIANDPSSSFGHGRTEQHFDDKD
ncbi:MAG: hypothetical protein SFU56_12555 [Capsulimonadales bacterium]|nr:hypothetical protein [Capsulimonadales bacterium]